VIVWLAMAVMFAARQSWLRCQLNTTSSLLRPAARQVLGTVVTTPADQRVTHRLAGDRGHIYKLRIHRSGAPLIRFWRVIDVARHDPACSNWHPHGPLEDAPDASHLQHNRASSSTLPAPGSAGLISASHVHRQRARLSIVIRHARLACQRSSADGQVGRMPGGDTSVVSAAVSCSASIAREPRPSERPADGKPGSWPDHEHPDPGPIMSTRPGGSPPLRSMSAGWTLTILSQVVAVSS
jgi:hypothetical protein